MFAKWICLSFFLLHLDYCSIGFRFTFIPSKFHCCSGLWSFSELPELVSPCEPGRNGPFLHVLFQRCERNVEGWLFFASVSWVRVSLDSSIVSQPSGDLLMDLPKYKAPQELLSHSSFRRASTITLKWSRSSADTSEILLSDTTSTWALRKTVRMVWPIGWTISTYIPFANGCVKTPDWRRPWSSAEGRLEQAGNVEIETSVKRQGSSRYSWSTSTDFIYRHHEEPRIKL